MNWTEGVAVLGAAAAGFVLGRVNQSEPEARELWEENEALREALQELSSKRDRQISHLVDTIDEIERERNELEDRLDKGEEERFRAESQDVTDKGRILLMIIEKTFGYCPWTSEDISELFGVNEETARRYVHALKETGRIEEVDKNGLKVYMLKKSRFK